MVLVADRVVEMIGVVEVGRQKKLYFKGKKSKAKALWFFEELWRNMFFCGYFLQFDGFLSPNNITHKTHGGSSPHK